jgi:hypothetical protein
MMKNGKANAADAKRAEQRPSSGAAQHVGRDARTGRFLDQASAKKVRDAAAKGQFKPDKR